MIPKKIHYCWFGGKPLSDEMEKFISTWHKYCPDYEFIKWDENNFDICQSIPFVKEAYEHKKYAFVSDYVRLCALYNKGGIYIDTDVELVKPLEPFLNDRFFTSIEYIEDNVRIFNTTDKLNSDGTKKDANEVITGIGIMSAFFGAEPKHPYIKDCMDFYKEKHFIQPDGSFYDKIILTVVLALCAEKYGFRYINTEQKVNEGIHFYPRDYFAHLNLKSENSVALHMAYNSWREKDIYHTAYNSLSKITILRNLKRSLMAVPLLNEAFDRLKKYVWFR